MTPAEYYAQIEVSTADLAELVTADSELTRPIPTCPGWTMRELAVHVGRVHRWAAEIVSTRSAVPISFRAVPDGKFPAAPAERAAWLTAGAQRVSTAVRDAGDAPVWAARSRQASGRAGCATRRLCTPRTGCWPPDGAPISRRRSPPTRSTSG
jgi:uncharacterized protein (TIGR03083 family)